MRITVKNERVNYQQESGVLIDDKLLSFEEFKAHFKELLENNSEIYKELKEDIIQAQQIMKIAYGPFEFEGKIHQITEKFSKFMGGPKSLKGLGGDIGLLTTFSFGKRTQRTYFLMHENNLPSWNDLKGQKTYENARKILIQLEKQIKDVTLLDKTFKQHLMNFSNQLRNPKLYTQEDFIALRKWSYQHLRSRWNAYESGSIGKISYSDYFWGKGQVHGFISEAYGTHLALIHPNALVGERISQLKTSVIEEHGGFGNIGLFQLLASTKGNVKSQLSGDIVIIDPNGKVRFNIQSKASINTKYPIEITYQKFLENMQLFLDIYEKYLNNKDNISDKDMQVLFNVFKTEAWKPIQQDVEENIEDIIDKELLEIMASI